MTAREGFAAALGAIRCREFRAKPETVGLLLLDPAHAAELTIESQDAAYGLGLGRVDDERALVGVITERHMPPIDMPFFFEAAILSRMRSPVTSRSNWAKDYSTLSSSC